MTTNYELPELDVTEEDREAASLIVRDALSSLGDESCICSIDRLACRERQLREAHATIAALRNLIGEADDEGGSLMWTSDHQKIVARDLASLRAPLTGEAMEAEVNKCVEAIWSAVNDPRKSGTKQKHAIFELLTALLLSTHNPLLERIRELEKLISGLEHENATQKTMLAFGRSWEADGYWRWQGNGEDHLESLTCAVAISASDLRGVFARAEAAEAKVRELTERLGKVGS